jgi:hypothetical protein
MLIVESYRQQNGIENKKEDDRRRARLESDLGLAQNLFQQNLCKAIMISLLTAESPTVIIYR